MGNSIIEIKDIWDTWFRFRQGKKYTNELHYFQYYLERNLAALHTSIEDGSYKHGFYRHFIVQENKKRTISVASLRDRVLHRLVYDYLVRLFDPTFSYDVWSCRKEKGLFGAVSRTFQLLYKNRNYFVWRMDITKFFDHVDHSVLMYCIGRRVKDSQWFWLICEIIKSYSSNNNSYERKRGIPIGNLSSQIFANIYLNELDRYVQHIIRPRGYLRYGDDCIVIGKNVSEVSFIREQIIFFLRTQLHLEIHKKHDILIPVRRGIRFLGHYISPTECRLNVRSRRRIERLVTRTNASSYFGLLSRYGMNKEMNYFFWRLAEQI